MCVCIIFDQGEGGDFWFFFYKDWAGFHKVGGGVVGWICPKGGEKMFLGGLVWSLGMESYDIDHNSGKVLNSRPANRSGQEGVLNDYKIGRQHAKVNRQASGATSKGARGERSVSFSNQTIHFVPQAFSLLG